MTVTYSLNVANTRLTGFSKLLLRWRGSIYKLLYREMFIFCGLYYFLSFLYRYAINENQRIVFEKLALYCEAFTKLIPLSFVLGFYVSIVVTRWWQQFMAIPWPDKLFGLIGAHIHGNDERGRVIKRTLARYLVLLQALTFQAVSTAVKKRFPTEDYIVEAGLMTKEEKSMYDEVPGLHSKWWTPIAWFSTIIVRSRKEGRIKDDVYVTQIYDELFAYRSGCGLMFAYDWISIPLVYTQTVTIATYTYFLATVMGRQYLDPGKGYSNHDIDLYIPVFTILEFFFFMGWLKVAEQLINPFGEDDDDFELNGILDRNLLVGVYLVDEICNKCPKLSQDAFWDELEPRLPYTKASAALRNQPHLGSAMRLDIDPEDTDFVPMSTIMEEDTEENSYTSPPNSPGTDITSPNFLQSSSRPDTAKDSDTTSQSTFKLFPDVLTAPSRLYNLIMGQSRENVNSPQTSLPMDQKDGKPMIAPFILKSPKKKRRHQNSVSTASNANSNMPSRANSIVLSESLKSGSELSAVTQPIPIALNRRSPAANFRTGASTPTERLSLIFDHDKSDTVSLGFPVRPGSSAEERETPRAFSRPFNRSLTPRSRSRNSSTVLNMPEGDDISIASTTATEPSTPVAAGPPTPEIQTNATDSPFESNSSQESLCPYESNQDTVTSMTQLLGKK